MTRLPTIVTWFVVITCVGSARGDTSTAPRGMVATVHPIATEAGVRALQQGGNAVDAAVAAALMLGVVDGHNSGLGGGCFILIRRADGEVVAIDGRETAPALATRTMFLRDGQADALLSRLGPLAVGVPGALAAYDCAMKECGSLSLAQLLRRAAKVAEQGFPIDSNYAARLQRTAKELRLFAGSQSLLLKADGSIYAEGELLRLPQLAHTLRQIAAHGTPWFYRGSLATRIGEWMQSNGGVLRSADFAAYKAKPRDPIKTTYRGYEVIGFPPPSSGGIHVAQILNILENFDLSHLLREDPSSAYHVIAEAMKLAFADRAFWLGDADFAPVPRNLTSKAYAKRLAGQIRMQSASQVTQHGLPSDYETDIYRKHTTHIAAADQSGNWVAITATINTTFGSKVVVPGTGLVLNNEMDDFSAQPGVPNAFGLVGAEANSVAPGKRPLSSMSPTIVLRDGEPILTLGAAGGPKIITQVVLAIVRYLDGQESLAASVAAPRIHHQWKPDVVFAETRLSPSLVEELHDRGQRIRFLTAAGITQAIGKSLQGGFIGVADPRVPGRAAGY